MNGRLYDPKLHRFLQPDNYVQDPSNTQNYNRYGYCVNNPLKYTDVSGEVFGWDDLAVAFIGGVINWAANGCQFNAAGLNYFATGVVAGIATYYGGPFAGAAVLGLGNSINKQLTETGKIDPWQLFGDTLTGVAITGATMGIMQGVSSIFTPVKPPLSVISTLKPAGLVRLQGAVLPAESMISTQIAPTTIANTAVATSKASNEIVKTGITKVVDGAAKFNCANCGYQELKEVVVNGTGRGFKSFNAFKYAFGRAGDGLAWHHIVEKTPGNITRFGNEAIHNTNNLIKLEHGSGTIHNEISSYYSRIHPFTNGQTFRIWISTKPFEEQYQIGMKKILELSTK